MIKIGQDICVNQYTVCGSSVYVEL